MADNDEFLQIPCICAIRIALIREWIPNDDGLEECEIDLWDMYLDYINGEREIAEIKASFKTDYYAG